MNTKIVFLDLEETIIKSIDNPRLIWANVVKVCAFVDNFAPDEIQTFSFALFSEMDKSNWWGVQRILRDTRNLEVKTQEFEIDDLKLAFLNKVVGRVQKHELIDFVQLCNKERVFEWMIKRDFQEGHFVLIDDTVESKTLTMKRGSLTIDFINVEDL